MQLNVFGNRLALVWQKFKLSILLFSFNTTKIDKFDTACEYDMILCGLRFFCFLVKKISKNIFSIFESDSLLGIQSAKPALWCRFIILFYIESTLMPHILISVYYVLSLTLGIYWVNLDFINYYKELQLQFY